MRSSGSSSAMRSHPVRLDFFADHEHALTGASPGTGGGLTAPAAAAQEVQWKRPMATCGSRRFKTASEEHGYRGITEGSGPGRDARRCMDDRAASCLTYVLFCRAVDQSECIGGTAMRRPARSWLTQKRMKTRSSDRLRAGGW